MTRSRAVVSGMITWLSELPMEVPPLDCRTPMIVNVWPLMRMGLPDQVRRPAEEGRCQVRADHRHARMEVHLLVTENSAF